MYFKFIKFRIYFRTREFDGNYDNVRVRLQQNGPARSRRSSILQQPLKKTDNSQLTIPTNESVNSQPGYF